MVINPGRNRVTLRTKVGVKAPEIKRGNLRHYVRDSTRGSRIELQQMLLVQDIGTYVVFLANICYI